MIRLIKSFWKVHHPDSRLLNNLTHGRNAGLLGGALSSITLYFAFFYGNMEKTFAGWQGDWIIALVLATLGTFAIAWLVDAANADNLPEAFDLILSPKQIGYARKSDENKSKLVKVAHQIGDNWRGILFSILIFLFSIGCVAFSAIIDWYGRGETAKTIVREPDKTDELAVIDSLNKVRLKVIAPIDTEIKAVQRDIRKAEKEVELRYPASVQKVKSKEDKWGWHAGYLQKEKAEATKALREQLAALRQQKSEVFDIETKTNQATIVAIQNDNQQKTENYLESLSFTEKASGGAGIFFGVMTLFCQLLLSLRNTAEQIVPEYALQHTKVVENGSTAASTNQKPATYPDMIPVRHDGDNRIIDHLTRQVGELSKELSNIKSNISTGFSTTVEKMPKPLSDNGDSRKVVEKPVEKISSSVEVVAVDVKNLRDRTMKQWERSFTSKTAAARQENKAKAIEGIDHLKALGFSVETDGRKISITSN